MGQILLVRHGQASFGAENYDALSPLGFEQSRLLGEALGARGIGVDAVVHGTMRRHRETAETCAAAAGWSAEPSIDAGWDEFDFLSVLAMHPHEYGPEPTKAEFQRLFEEATEAWMAGVDRPYDETFADFAARVHDALERTVELATVGTVAVFTSGGPIGLAVAEVLADPGSLDTQLRGLWGRLNRMTVNSALTRVVSGSTGLNLLTYNDQSHLDAVAGAVTYR
ncbi:broad specificity phosphatase PhoE [Marmoricola sp. OAE513]|uniref:histidine phosphatase family protein n=1 Tax=Marmoricola sp. OAE513 TaxID=2817894 RepID=UPI001AE89432